jgi:hypothetical protein
MLYAVEKMKSIFNITKNVPLPKRKRLAGRQTIYPFKDMDVHDSFFVPNKKFFTSYRNYEKKNPKTKFCVRHVTENGVKGIRVWRTK